MSLDNIAILERQSQQLLDSLARVKEVRNTFESCAVITSTLAMRDYLVPHLPSFLRGFSVSSIHDQDGLKFLVADTTGTCMYWCREEVIEASTKWGGQEEFKESCAKFFDQMKEDPVFESWRAACARIYKALDDVREEKKLE